MKNNEFFLTQLYTEDGVEVKSFTKEEEEIAADNNCTISVGLEPSVILGFLTREEAEKRAKQKD
ncbi:hypothetical protein CP985_13535 [Malaciobacter mytili LMG 24559]|uniref:Uncharacterized protein n=1 Tax=Malaciobacter mytili LMG 24559 TaxID=1032238 RepID=A0AAX2AEX6_9BACT|nr:hypothetical protein [Malaciobacter mytili]AXH16467.1 hypothetical protein AMYT_a0169 [Malaciobacter mytili LMG 24559]RXK12972.1 hypothetical protein CP985_13535 [Malaciobacter mytili LMG 24559]